MFSQHKICSKRNLRESAENESENGKKNSSRMNSIAENWIFNDLDINNNFYKSGTNIIKRSQIFILERVLSKYNVDSRSHIFD